MKLPFTKLSAFTFLGVAMLIAATAAAHQANFQTYSYPNGTGSNYTKVKLTCNTGAPDYDQNCVNGDNMTVQWFVRTRAQAEVDLEYGVPFSVHLSGPEHWDCEVSMGCSDGSWADTSVVDNPCGWTTCPAGTFSNWVGVYTSITTTPP